MFLYVDMHGNNPHNFCDDEREGSEVEGPAIRVALFRVTLPRVPSIGRYINYDADDVA